MKFIFLMDPLETIKVEKDTTLMLMLGAHKRGHEVYFLPEGGITVENNKLYFDTLKVIPQYDLAQPFVKGKAVYLSEDEVHVVFIRTDPPFDVEYLSHTWLLDLLPPSVVVINKPSGIRSCNEKIWCSRFADLTPATLITRDLEKMKAFVHKEKDVIAKPTDGFGGKSVFRIKEFDSNTNVILETLSDDGKKEIILQHYIAEAKAGDKRILLLDGEPLGAILRVQQKTDHRQNLYAGGKAFAAKITSEDKRIIDRLKPFLKEMGLYLVGIDILGHYLVEVNVTSPTCLQEMNQLYNEHLEEKVISFVENLVEQCHSRNL